MKMANDELPGREMGAWELLANYFRHPQVLLTTLAFATGVLYSGTLSFQFVWDDGPQIVDNPLIRSWRSLSRVLVSDLWHHTARRQVYYRPLFVAWSIVNYALVGLRPWGWHLGAILLHLGATLAVFWLCRRLGLEYWTAALATLIFAVHPIHIECVAWISAASDSMVTMFAALAFVAFLNARDPAGTHRRAWQVASLSLLGCALLTKEMAVCFTGLVALYLWLCPRRDEHRREEQSPSRLRQVLLGVLPYAAVTLCYVLLRKLVLLHSPFVFDPKHGYGDMALALPYVLAVYLRQLVLPLGLTGLYYTPYPTTQILAQFVLPLLILSAVVWLVVFWARRTGDWLVLFAGGWLLFGLAPALYLRSFGNGDFVRDRYMYLPSIGFAILAAKAIRLLPAVRGCSATAVQGCAIAAVCLAYVGMSVPQQAYWDSDLLVYMRGEQLYPENPYAMVGLAKEYSQRGAYEKAIALAEAAVREHPEYGYASLALAETYIQAGRFDEGRVALRKALLISPDYAKSETGMASLAGLYGRMGDFEEAIALCDQVLAKEPDLYSALYNCGNVHLLAGQYAEAQRLLLRAMAAVPNQAGPKHFLGRALLEDGKNQQAQPYLLQAVAINATVWDYHYWLAVSLEQSGNMPAARQEYRRALQLNPDSKEAEMRLTALELK